MDDRKTKKTGRPDLWSSALAFYAQPGIAPLCLRRQAEGGTDVMLLIAHCHALARQDAPLTATELDALRDHSRPWLP